MNFEKSYDSPYDDVDVGLKKFMTGVYSWMTIGVLILQHKNPLLAIECLLIQDSL